MLLKNRPLVAWKSRNKGSGDKPRVYSRAILQELIPVLEGESIFLNHSENPAKGKRPFQDLIGRAVNVHFDEQTGLRADLELSDFHPEARRIADHVEKNLPLGGISLDAITEGAMVDGREVLTHLRKFNSLDFVAEPAGFRISESEADPLSEDEKKLIEASYVPKADFDSLKAEHAAVISRITALESKYSAPPAAVVPPAIEPPAPPAYVPPTKADPAKINDLIKRCRS